MEAGKLIWFNGGLSEKERGELTTLEYVLTWNYSEDYDKDCKRYKQLSDQTWKFRENNMHLLKQES